MKLSLIKQAFPIIALIFILTAVTWFNFYSSKSVRGESCQFHAGQCSTIHDEKKVTVSVHDPIEIEEELNLSIYFPEDYVLVRSWVEGVNMFMGRFFIDLKQQQTNQGENQQDGILFLGSCSEPEMQWKLVVELKHSTTSETLFREYLFSTRQY